MKSLMTSSIAVAIALLASEAAQAQTAVVTYFAPAVPTIVYYAPTYAVAAPVAAPAAAYFGSTRAYYPAVVPAARPVVTSVVTRRRPILGGTVTRYAYRYAPVYYLP